MQMLMMRFVAIILFVIWTAAGGAWAGYLEDGKASAKEGDYNEAVEAFTNAIRSGVLQRLDLSTAFLLRGDAYQNLEDFESALEDYERALRMRQYDDAITDLNDALRLNPNAGSAYLARGHAHLRA